jgi:hypothetical protein
MGRSFRPLRTGSTRAIAARGYWRAVRARSYCIDASWIYFERIEGGVSAFLGPIAISKGHMRPRKSNYRYLSDLTLFLPRKPASKPYAVKVAADAFEACSQILEDLHEIESPLRVQGIGHLPLLQRWHQPLGSLLKVRNGRTSP